MLTKIIGNITLNISFVCYLFLFAVQLWHNLVYKSTPHLSFTMHLLLCSSCILDFAYGFGRHMPWQYRLVTISGLICLTVQHIQIYIYANYTTEERSLFWMASIFLLSLLVYTFFRTWFQPLNYRVLIAAGNLSQIGWIIYVIPQIVKNYRSNTAKGVSFYFVLLGVIASLCDTLSAWCLNWDVPNKFGSPIGLLLKLILLKQIISKSRYSKDATERKGFMPQYETQYLPE